MRLVFAESEKFAAKVAADQSEMDAKAESFRAAGAGLEAQLSEGLGKIKTAQAAADAANLIQAESTRNSLAKLLEHDAEMRALNEQNISRITAKFWEIDAARAAAAAAAPVDPLQQRDQAGLDWQAGRLGRPNTGIPRRRGVTRRVDVGRAECTDEPRR